jgi:hypothetical protein
VEHDKSVVYFGTPVGGYQQKTGGWLDSSLGSRQSILLVCVPTQSQKSGDAAIDEPQGKLLGQCTDGKLLGELKK